MRKLLAWLSKRFPEQRIVTIEEWKQIKDELYRINQVYADLHSRLVQTDANVKKLNDMNGYVTTSKNAFKLER
jgi:hypothetical protein